MITFHPLPLFILWIFVVLRTNYHFIWRPHVVMRTTASGLAEKTTARGRAAETTAGGPAASCGRDLGSARKWGSYTVTSRSSQWRGRQPWWPRWWTGCGWCWCCCRLSRSVCAWQVRSAQHPPKVLVKKNRSSGCWTSSDVSKWMLWNSSPGRRM